MKESISESLFEPILEYVFELRVDVDPEFHIGRSVDERLGFTPITGGTVAGPLLNGEILTGGGDWSVERSGTSQLEARYLIRADDGAVIDILNRGYFHASSEVLARHDRGEEVGEDEVYFRTAPVFQTDAAEHRWLAEHQFIGLARDGVSDAGHDQICIRVFVLR